MKNYKFMFKHTLILTFLCTLSLQAQFTFDSNTPAAVANNIALDANITLNFSDNTKTASITAANIVITGRYTGIIAGVFSGGGTKTVVFNPTTNFKPGEVIAVTLTAAILNSTDAVLTNPTSFSFTSKSALNAFTPSWTDNYVADDAIESSYTLPVDIDGDGDMDLVSGGFRYQKISLHKNDGNANPSFTTTIIAEYGAPTKPRQAFASDIDNDGDMDIITLNVNTGKTIIEIITLKNNGDGSSWEKNLYHYSGRVPADLKGIPSIFMADIDNDGDVDLAVASANYAGKSYCMWFENISGTFLQENAHRIKYNSDYKNSISLADIDNDGDIDVIVASSNTNTISWYKNDGSADFSNQIDITTSATLAQAIYAADMDNDGDIDIIAVKKNTISWYENDGSADPTFAEENIATGVPSSSEMWLLHNNSIAISAADINNDGHMDILSAKSWYLNDGNANPSWTAAQFRTSTNDIRSIYAADMDGDGDMDILATSFDDSEISWYENSITNTWDGSAGNAWGTGENWDTGVIPTTVAPFEKIVIPGNLTNYPTAANAVVVTSVDMTSGSSLIASNTFSGEINYKRSIGSTNWQFISSPVSGQDIDAFIGAQSVAAGTDDNRGLSDYNNTTEAFTYWQAGTTNSGNFVLGDGRAIKLSETEDITFTGTLSTEKVDIAITSNTNGFNLIGNPYPSYIAANTGADAVNNLLTINDVDNDFLTEATLWLWDQSNESYTTKNLASAAFFIAPGQGFFVSANGDKTFRFTEEMQSHQGTDTFLKTNNNRPEIKVSISNGTVLKHAEIYYIAGTTTSFDNGYDSSIFGGSSQNFSLYTHAVANSTGRKLGIQSLPNSDYESMVIPIGITTAADIEITFSIETLNLPKGLKVYVEDRENNTFTRLDLTGTNYSFTPKEALNGVGRLNLHTSNSTLSTDETSVFKDVTVYKLNSEVLRITGLPKGKSSIKLFNLLGQQILSTSFQSNGTYNAALPKRAAGAYIFQIETEKGKLNKKIILE
ncbi:FG-GAP-like repeat-containing protein [Polaribacter sp. IC073]|uniref:FG-GAP-like repeat-containing protein n=1 Tax=Polaribacter sp. IC073 TaxID=2508540 RepID=UPI0011BF2B1A|nr:FG-GAP-like repeat-containing protein [Polaribacter sp. IC073]TXD49042.1 T9SS type A sorting domain-containing protein [Polaribacter sp. IC073]